MAQDVSQTPLKLNLGCGFKKRHGWLNVDKYNNCNPDVVWDLDETPWPWDDNIFFEISAFHIFEHLQHWWSAFEECARVLKINGTLEIRIPHDSSSKALGYRDHVTVFSKYSFHGIRGWQHGTSAWAKENENIVPLQIVEHLLIPYEKYNWMIMVPSLLRFCANHMRNFVWEQAFIFQKIKPDREVNK